MSSSLPGSKQGFYLNELLFLLVTRTNVHFLYGLMISVI
jgi:hypothetical protein